MTFQHPVLFWALPVLGLLVWLLELRLPAGDVRRFARWSVRMALLAVIVAALAGPTRERREPLARRVVVAVDASNRITPGAEAEARAIAERLRSQARDVGVTFDTIRFTTKAAAPGEAPPASETSFGATGLAGARLRFREHETGGIVLVSDGHGNLSGVSAAADALRREGLAVASAAVPADVPVVARPPRIVSLRAPRRTSGPFEVRCSIEADAPKRLEVVLRVNGVERGRDAVEARPDGEVLFEDVELEPGLHEIAVELTDPDDNEERTLRRTLVEVGTPPRVVALLGDAAGSPWRKALSAQGLHVAAIKPGGLADFVADGRRAPDLVLADAAALAALPTAAIALLAERVREGLGLLIEAGGSQESWDALSRSALVGLLPLRPLPEPEPPPPEPKPQEEEPEPPIDPPEPDEGPGLKAERRPEEALPITLLLVLDRSPSMIGDKLQMAIEGARQAALALSPWDRIGVITFADDSTLDIRPRSARGASSIPLWLSTVEAGGRGTNIYGALKLASRVLAREKSPILHLILLTDGRQYPDGPIFGPVVKPMRARGVTITALGIGRGARMDQLRDIVQWAAAGQVIPVGNIGAIPRVITRDTMKVAEKRRIDAEKLDARLRDKNAEPKPPEPQEEEKPQEPRPRSPEDAAGPKAPGAADSDTLLPLRVRRAHEALAGLSVAGLPTIGLPRRSEPTYDAAVLLAREDGRPVLAAGRPGLGRVLVWTLPARDPGIFRWKELGRLYGQAARSVIAPRGAFAFLPEATVEQGPDGAALRVIWPPGETQRRLRVRWEGPNGMKDLGVFAPDDGVEGRILPAAPVAALCRLHLELEPGPALPGVSYLVEPPPVREPMAGDREGLAAAVGSAPDALDGFIAALPTGTRPVTVPLWSWFLWLAVALLPLDVWLHRRRGLAR